MPRYDYECEVCHYRFELKQSFSSEPTATCPNCKNGARRKIHAVPVVFKGSGWYVNDHGKRGGLSGSTSDSKESSDSASDSKESTDTSSKSKGSGPSAKSEGRAGSKPKSEPAKAATD